MKIIKVLVAFTAVFLLLWGATEEGFSREECSNLRKLGYDVERSIMDCKVLIHDSWMDSEEYFQSEYEKANK